VSKPDAMKIPADAIIPPGKLVNYLLTPRAKDDKSRFLARAGFDQSNPEVLEAAIRRACASAEARVDRVNQYGTYYKLRCELTGPAGVEIRAILVWLCRLDGVYSFVTLIPDTETPT
jgi:hypothetical protein